MHAPTNEQLINPVDIYSPAALRHELLILIVSQLIKLTPFLFIPALLMGLTLPLVTFIDPSRVAAFCSSPQKWNKNSHRIAPLELVGIDYFA